MNSFEPNQAAEPPVSRMSVPVWPSHKPRKPVVLMTVFRTSIGPGSLAVRGVYDGKVLLNCAAGIGDIEGGGATSMWTCILHLISSTGVLMRKEKKTATQLSERRSNGHELRAISTESSRKRGMDGQDETCDSTSSCGSQDCLWKGQILT